MAHWQPDPRNRVTREEFARITRDRTRLPMTWLCTCGRPFTTRGGRTNHARRCVWDVWLREQELTRAVAALHRALTTPRTPPTPAGTLPATTRTGQTQ